jgi:hypothetical protein
MTPPNKMAETMEQVVKILKSPGCRYVRFPEIDLATFDFFCHRKNPVFVNSIEKTVELATSFGTERSAVSSFHFIFAVQ